jgi:hypothetical protein
MDNNQALLLAEVLHITCEPAKRVFALADGARFDDLPGALAASGLYHRSLYLNVQDAELVRAGPWLIDPYRQPDLALNAWGGLPLNSDAKGDAAITADTEAAVWEKQPGASSFTDALAVDPDRQLETLIQLTGDTPAAVFWIGNPALTEVALWQHLRTLNMALIPKEYDREPQGATRDSLSSKTLETHEAVLFRHGDGNVLAEVLPVLDAVQFSRVFGPANALMFVAPGHPGSDGTALRRALLPENSPPAPPGMLKLSMQQMEEIEAIRHEASRRKVMDYLRDVDPGGTDGLSDAQLQELVVKYEEAGGALGLKSERAQMKWAYLMSVSDSEMAKRPETRQYFLESSKHPDDRIDDLMHMFDDVWTKSEKTL